MYEDDPWSLLDATPYVTVQTKREGDEDIRATEEGKGGGREGRRRQRQSRKHESI